jgi:hypothetical protein
MPNVVSAIDGTSHEIQIPSNEPQQKTYFQQNNSFRINKYCTDRAIYLSESRDHRWAKTIDAV